MILKIQPKEMNQNSYSPNSDFGAYLHISKDELFVLDLSQSTLLEVIDELIKMKQNISSKYGFCFYSHIYYDLILFNNCDSRISNHLSKIAFAIFQTAKTITTQKMAVDTQQRMPTSKENSIIALPFLLLSSFLTTTSFLRWLKAKVYALF